MYKNKLNSNVFDKYFDFTEYTNDFADDKSIQSGASSETEEIQSEMPSVIPSEMPSAVPSEMPSEMPSESKIRKDN